MDDILFFEHRHRKIVVHILKGQHEILNVSLSRVEETVADYSFIRTHRAYVVQTKKVYKLVNCGDRSAQIFFHNTDKKVAYLSRGYRDTFPFFTGSTESALGNE